MKALVVVLGWLAAGLIAAGLVVGFALPVKSGDYACGSAFRESSELYADELADTFTGGDGANDCDQARSSARTLPIVMLVLGACLAGAAVSVRATGSTPAAPESAQP